ncbi:MAG: tRNA (guanosine(37)-N1)-methyltransferase TrmD [Holophagales bacterium]|nr:tRNA (guanosine(37)-N1)-methyltransferase TrmD [Holophagales bacterium]MYD20877.1 tRNA (guanosine(37)-N1)-methyltransferase TrmD [Holophagales bacterium]MYI33769.1 tRNA (guanosine(37)-N1)-methyltransferase TrmD [Holophagales bacterium]
MRIDVITIFPAVFREFLGASLIGRAIAAGLLEVHVHDLRHYTEDPHRSVDDEPYGGGGGMVMTAPPWLRAVRAVSGDGPRPHRILLSPQGERLDDASVRSLAGEERLVLLCGRYEAIDERVRMLVVDSELSIGDYVLAGGEVPAMAVIEAVSRHIPGVVGRPESVENESFRSGLLDHPHYTRPRTVEGIEVPDVLRSGDHARIDAWRREQALEATRRKRPDLLAGDARGHEVAPKASNRR